MLAGVQITAVPMVGPSLHAVDLVEPDVATMGPL
jgi:hypothetical protein